MPGREPFPARPSPGVAVATRAIRCASTVDLRLTLVPLQSAGGLTMRFAADGVWRATRTPDGPATIHLRGGGDRVDVEAWGGAGNERAACRQKGGLLAR